ncbi:MAG TPA: DNA polymerase I [Bacteroidia bacterium]|nr:DNA polymerase I [Bacteroidia bacterium]
MSEEKKLFLLDGMALIYRAFFAFSQSPRITSYGLNTNAPYGLVNTLLDVLNRQKPSHIAVVFDTDKPTDRHIEYTDYKANRQEMPEDLSRSIPYVFRLIEGFNIPVITYDGFEADDIIGTLAKKAEKKGYKVYMMTPDKDFGQLVSDNIFIYKPGRQGGDFEIMGVPEILQRWEISSINQVIDILGLMGDAVDNIPGIPGIGEKTAKKLVQEFGSVENLLDNTAKLKGKQKENIEANAEMARLSKRLATIITEVPIELDERALILDEPNKEKLMELFAELEFRTLGKRLFGEGETSVAQPSAQPSLFSSVEATQAAAEPEEKQHSYRTAATMPHRYELCDTPEKRAALITQLKNATEWCFDTETTSLDAIEAELVGLAFSLKPYEGYYIPTPANRAEAQAIVDEFKPVFETENILKIAQNIKYDIMVLQNYGVNVKGELFDTMLAHYVIEPDGRHNMDIMAEGYLNYAPISIETLIGKKGKGQLNMRDADIEKVAEYSAEDADITLRLKQAFSPMLDEKGVRPVVEKIEAPLVPVLADMEREGVRIDKEMLAAYSVDLQNEVALLEQRIYELAGMQFNIASPKQLGEVLFDRLKLDPKAKKTKTGQYKTDEEVLTYLSAEHEIAKVIIDHRQMQKLKSTYVDALPLLINPRTGRVHTCFNQAVAATGRLSSTDPNLQNIPIRTDRGREVRKAFIPRDSNHVLLSADYSQIELRIVAAISKDASMIDDFTKGLDIHTATAAKVFGVTIDNVDKDMRRKAKMVNFGIIYGISAFGLAQRLEIPRKEAAEIIDNYFKQYPDLRKYMNDTVDFARQHGFVQTVMGRRRYLRDINSANHTVRSFAERNAINAPIQGSAADMIKLAMINIHRRFKDEKVRSKMILQVHDELLFDVERDEVEKIKPIIREEMLNAIKLEVPLEVEMGVGENWLEAH